MVEFDTGDSKERKNSGAQIWRGDGPLILASQSRARRALLLGVGLDVEVIVPDVDERATERELAASLASPENLAKELARAKALAVSRSKPDAYVLGADQTLALEGRVFHKSRNFADAAETLAKLAGKTHRLISAFCIARSGQTLANDADHASLRMRALDRSTISAYLDLAGPEVLASVGAYQVEGLGAHLFESIEGDHSVVLGLPIFKLLAWLRRESLILL
jgi:septum formation protein